MKEKHNITVGTFRKWEGVYFSIHNSDLIIMLIPSKKKVPITIPIKNIMLSFTLNKN